MEGLREYNKGKKVKSRFVTTRLSEETYKKVKKKTLDEGLPLTRYIYNLIVADLNEE